MISLWHAGKYLTLDIYVASPTQKKKKKKKKIYVAKFTVARPHKIASKVNFEKGKNIIRVLLEKWCRAFVFAHATSWIQRRHDGNALAIHKNQLVQHFKSFHQTADHFMLGYDILLGKGSYTLLACSNNTGCTNLITVSRCPLGRLGENDVMGYIRKIFMKNKENV